MLNSRIGLVNQAFRRRSKETLKEAELKKSYLFLVDSSVVHQGVVGASFRVPRTCRRSCRPEER